VLKTLAKSLMPASAIKAIQTARTDRQLEMLHPAWIAAREALMPVQPLEGAGRILLVPSDPVQIAGSCGDEAMVMAVKRMAEESAAGTELHVLVWNAAANAAAERLGLIPVPIWTEGDFIGAIIRELKARRFRAAVGMGADMIDGIYGALEPAKQLVALDMATRLGVPSAVIGCSFSEHIDLRLKRYFDALHSQMRILARDAVSLERVRAFTVATSELVADSAFMLQPATVDSAVEAWIASRRAEGKKVIGINVHPMLLPRYDEQLEELLISPTFAALTRAAAQRKVAFLLIPHDRRKLAGDASVLEPLHARLETVLGKDVMLLEGFRSAAELKATAGRLDGVVTGRMHLAIGSLGSGVPVMCIVYQGKFEGLMTHFNLPADVLISVPELGNTDVAATRILSFIDRSEALKEQVAARKPLVLEHSRRNFAHFG